jgi:hypothetical protein
MRPHIPNVWLLQEPRTLAIDTEDASKYGTIRPVLSRDVNPAFAPGQALVTMARAFRDDYRPGDFLLYAPADPIVPLLAGLALHASGATREPMKWLRWERRNRDAPPEDRATRGRAGFYVPSILDARPLFGFQGSTFDNAHGRD